MNAQDKARDQSQGQGHRVTIIAPRSRMHKVWMTKRLLTLRSRPSARRGSRREGWQGAPLGATTGAPDHEFCVIRVESPLPVRDGYAIVRSTSVSRHYLFDEMHLRRLSTKTAFSRHGREYLLDIFSVQGRLTALWCQSTPMA